MVTLNQMTFRHVTVELPSRRLIAAGVVPEVFFEHNESLEILHVYAFQPRERVVLARVVRSGPALSEDEIQSRRGSLRRRYRLRDFEILRIEDGGRAYLALLRQSNPGPLAAVLEELGAGATPTTPTTLRRNTTTISFIADEAAEKRIYALLDGVSPGWRLRRRRLERVGPRGMTELTPRQREILNLAWNLGYFDVPARSDLARLARLTGLSRNTVSQHLRRALRRILRDHVG
jgi:predicted DNA binding protein